MIKIFSIQTIIWVSILSLVSFAFAQDMKRLPAPGMTSSTKTFKPAMINSPAPKIINAFPTDWQQHTVLSSHYINCYFLSQIFNRNSLWVLVGLAELSLFHNVLD